VILTGTLLGGYADELFNILYRLDTRMMREEGFDHGESGVRQFAEAYGARTYMNLGGGLNRPRASETDPPPFLQWTTPTLFRDFDVISPIELRLDAACIAPDTAFIAGLQDVDENENAINVTADYLRAGLRAVDQAASRRGTPFLPCRTFKAVPVGEKVSYC
jgi:uncharacterized protein